MESKTKTKHCPNNEDRIYKRLVQMLRDEGVPGVSQGKYKVYAERWFVLAALCLLAVSNAAMWISFSPLTVATAKWYCEPVRRERCEVAVDTSNIFQLVGVVTGIFGMYITDRYGIRVSLFCGTFLNAIGAVVRFVSTLETVSLASRMWILYAGSATAAMAQPFFLVLSPKVAEYWFAENQRALANVLSFIANPLGVALVSTITIFLDEKNVENLGYLNIVLLILALFTLLVSLFVRRASPPTPPSASNEHHQSPNQSPAFGQALCMLFKNRQFIVQMFTFGLAFALQWSFFVIYDPLFIALGYTSLAKFLNTITSIIGGISSIFAGILVDRTKRFKEVIRTCYIGFAICSIALNLYLRHAHSSPLDTAVVALLCAMLGFFSIPVFPIAIEMGVEETYPVQEATSSGILVLAGQCMLYTMTTGMQYSQESEVPEQMIDGDNKNYYFSLDIWTTFACVAVTIACFLLRPTYNRVEFERNCQSSEASEARSEEGRSHIISHPSLPTEHATDI